MNRIGQPGGICIAFTPMKRIAVLLVLVMAGCAGGKTTRRLKLDVEAPPEAWQGITRVVVLPPDNWTLDLGLEYITWYRAVINELVREKGYQVVPLVEVNRFFLKNRFTLAGESLGSYTYPELAKALNADAMLFWDITTQGPKLIMNVVKADGTHLWSTGEVSLSMQYVARTHIGFHEMDKGIALALGEILRKLPGKS